MNLQRVVCPRQKNLQYLDNSDTGISHPIGISSKNNCEDL